MLIGFFYSISIDSKPHNLFEHIIKSKVKLNLDLPEFSRPGEVDEEGRGGAGEDDEVGASAAAGVTGTAEDDLEMAAARFRRRR